MPRADRLPPGELLKRALTGRYLPHGDPDTADCVIGFAFGYCGGESPAPGLSNEQLAAAISSRWPRLPVVVQHELAGYFEHAGVPLHSITGSEREGRYLDTRTVARQAAAILSAEGLSRPLVVAHQHHLPRADAVCRRLGLETIVAAEMRIDFDPRSAQPFTRDAAAWRRRECLVVPYYRLRGWL